MPRVLETELMTDDTSVNLYNSASKNSPLANIFIEELNKLSYNPANILDIGCGPCNYYNELSNLFPNANIHGVDGSAKMIAVALGNVPAQINISLSTIAIPSDKLLYNKYDLIISSLALHQFAEPSNFWQAIKKHGKQGGKFFVFDLLRIEDENDINEVVNAISPINDETFKNDFSSSLKASFTQLEIINQFNSEEISGMIFTLELYPKFRVIFIHGVLN
jgi:SAM-dependent methyltransferase